MLGRVFTIYIILYYFSTVFALYTGEVRLDDYTNKVERRDQVSERKKKINAVLFFADTIAGEDYHNASGISCLKLEKKPEIKHCSEYPRSGLLRRRRQWRYKRHTCSCYNRLQEGIVSLLNYAQNTLGMVTALGSLSNHSFSNSIRFGSTEIHINDHIDTKEEKPDKTLDEKVKIALQNGPGSPTQGNEETTIEENSTEENPTEENPSEENPSEENPSEENPSEENPPEENPTEENSSEENTDSAPSLSDKEEEQLRKIPLLNVFPKDSPPPFYKFTDAEERAKRAEGPYVLSPEHTEIFKIRTKRYMPVSKPKEISDSTYLNREQKVRTIFDIMDIMNTLQRSLFGSMMQDDSDSPHEREECPIHHNFYRKPRQPGLFEVVQKTLFTVINASDTGFLMIIIGGKLSDIASSYSPLVQSIKHVAENTEEDSTLIVLTGTCPNSPDAAVKLPCEELNKKNLPLFAMGPGSEEFSNCYELYDVPLTVKRILSKFNSKRREAQPQDLEIPLHQRSKRNILDMEDEEEEYEEEEYSHVDSRRSSHVTGGMKGKMKNSGQFIHYQRYFSLGILSLSIYSVYNS